MKHILMLVLSEMLMSASSSIIDAGPVSAAGWVREFASSIPGSSTGFTSYQLLVKE